MGVLPFSGRLTYAMDMGVLPMFRRINLCNGYGSVQIQYLCSTKGLLKQSKYTEKLSQHFLKYSRN